MTELLNTMPWNLQYSEDTNKLCKPILFKKKNCYELKQGCFLLD